MTAQLIQDVAVAANGTAAACAARTRAARMLLEVATSTANGTAAASQAERAAERKIRNALPTAQRKNQYMQRTSCVII